jgi:hypothetical protein
MSLLVVMLCFLCWFVLGVLPVVVNVLKKFNPAFGRVVTFAVDFVVKRLDECAL